jgi:hypothetical protein
MSRLPTTELLLQGFLHLRIRLPSLPIGGFLHLKITLLTLHIQFFLHLWIRLTTLPLQSFLHLWIRLPTLPSAPVDQISYLILRGLMHLQSDALSTRLDLIQNSVRSHPQFG